MAITFDCIVAGEKNFDFNNMSRLHETLINVAF